MIGLARDMALVALLLAPWAGAVLLAFSVGLAVGWAGRRGLAAAAAAVAGAILRNDRRTTR